MMRACPVVQRRMSVLAAVGDTLLALALILSTAFVAGASFAARADDDLPGRVGRIADFAGQLYQSPEDRATEWVAIGLNYPVTSGDNLWVSGDGRAEVDYGGGQFRLAGDTNLHISRLDENQLALFIAQGRVILRVRMLDPGESARVDAPNTQIQLTRPGLYRIDVTPDREVTQITVREGEAQVALPSGVQQALPGQTVTVTGQDAGVADVRNGIGQDGFDTWSASRDRRYEKSRTATYVSRQMVGYADLDEYGTWQTVPEYGAVWYPSAVPDDWAPYRDGYWTTVGGWGYTWVDAAPWGYAPFHYGRWARVGGRWGWCPGAYVARPVWAPALVGWYGGAGWGISATVGSPVYGWVPLGWGEPYHPWWRRCSNNCWAQYNRPYAVNVSVRPTAPPSHYRNIGVPGAVTAVSGATLAGRVPVANNLVRVPPQQVATAPVLAAAPIVGSGPLHVPVVRPGSGGTPPPASTFYPVTRGRPADGALVRKPPQSGIPAGAAGQAATPGGSTRVIGAPVAPRPAPAAGISAPAVDARTPIAPRSPGNAPGLTRPSPTVSGPTSNRNISQPEQGATSLPVSRTEARAQPRSSPREAPATTGPAPGLQPLPANPVAAPEARPSPQRAPVDRGVPIPSQMSRAAPAAAVAAPAFQPHPANAPPAAAPAMRPSPQRAPAGDRGVPNAPPMSRAAPTAPGVAAPNAAVAPASVPRAGAPAGQAPARGPPPAAVHPEGERGGGKTSRAAETTPRENSSAGTATR
jgi:hypothetical protein